MELLNKESGQNQLGRLQDIVQYSREALELCASLGDYQTSLTKFKNRKDIFERAVQGLKQVLPIAFYSFYAVDEASMDIELEHCDRPELEPVIEAAVDHLIEKGTVALALREKRTLTAMTRDRKYNLLLHALATTSKTYGIFICFLEKKPFEQYIIDKITTIIIKSTCYALENFELYRLIDQKNEELIDKNVQLSKSEIIYRNTFENTGNPTLIVDSQGKTTYSNSEFLQFSGYSRNQLIGRKNISDFIIQNPRLSFPRLLLKAKRDRQGKPTEYVFENQAGEKKMVFLKISPLGLDDQYIISLTDVTTLKEIEKKLQFQAFHDHLTNLPNRLLLQDRLKQAIKKRKRNKNFNYALIFIDLDRFKTINDTMGHHFGDQLLIQVAKKMSKSIRDMDTLARFGGDEFVILLEDIQGAQDCELVSQRIINEFKRPLDLNGHEIFLTMSMGILVSTEQQVEQADVIRLADMSMYEAKKKGRNQVIYFHEIEDKDIEQKLLLENHLQSAIQKGEFFVQYQPLIDLNTNQLHGLETLVRWRHPELGIVPPNSFIPIAEETGLIIPLGQKIFELAFTDFVRWLSRFSLADKLCLSINLSVKQLFEKDFVEKIRTMAAEAGLPLEKVNLEITESIFIDNTTQVLQTINKLKKLGISISIDDFGTGYSSLKYLNQFSIDLVKIDKLLTKNITSDKTNFNIVNSMLELCAKLDIKVMAEGIEELHQLDKLKEMKCHLGQGFYFAPPQNKKVIEQMLLQENTGRNWPLVHG
ncbi:MAG: bifunctional diguanylate cyclase/phosphodiesterase [Desulfohalobiaceae bacterium]|nr:bifunctional diguanylate cyclase/phosphodiesterase [Desulfohalobiaceae bacterium]